MNSGYIRVFRKTLDNCVIMTDSDHLALFIYLLLNATHKEKKVIFDGEQIILKKGELVTGRRLIAEKLKISDSKIQRILDKFANHKIIEQLKTKKGRLIIIKKWDDYQVSEPQVNHNRTTSEPQVNTNNNVIMKESILEERNSNIEEITNNTRIVEKEEIYKEEKEKIFDYDWMSDDSES